MLMLRNKALGQANTDQWKQIETDVTAVKGKLEQIAAVLA